MFSSGLQCLRVHLKVEPETGPRPDSWEVDRSENSNVAQDKTLLGESDGRVNLRWQLVLSSGRRLPGLLLST